MTTIYSSQQARGFFPSDIFGLKDEEGNRLPADACEIDRAHYLALIEGQQGGRFIDFDVQPPVLRDPPPLTEAQLEAMAAQAVNSMLDELAQSWQYSSYESARTYKGDVNAKFNAEGTALANYGSACYAYLDQIKAGAVPKPADADALLKALPEAPSRPVVP